MRKYQRLTLFILFALMITLSAFSVCLNAFADNKEVYIGGMPAGFTLKLGGVQVVGICEVLTQDGAKCPAKDADISVGDIIKSVNGIKIESAQDLDTALKQNESSGCTISIYRNGDTQSKNVLPAKDITNGKCKLGVLVRDSVSGIGTITYIEKGTLKFGSLGHPLLDENGECMNACGGKIFNCSIVNVVRGTRGKAGELKGIFLNDKCVATAEKNCEAGIFGKFNQDYDFSHLESVKIADENDVVQGKATIYTTIDGITPKQYSVSIIKIDKYNKQNKNFVIKITDNELIENAGGIVQGMSGSPIIQNGKLIGAITHVFLNDPTRGYGISIENMIN